MFKSRTALILTWTTVFHSELGGALLTGTLHTSLGSSHFNGSAAPRVQPTSPKHRHTLATAARCAGAARAFAPLYTGSNGMRRRRSRASDVVRGMSRGGANNSGSDDSTLLGATADGMEALGESDDKAEQSKVPLVSWVSLAMLLLVYVSNQWTRSLVYYVQNFDVANTADTAKEFMNIGLGFDETQYGLLASFSFTLLFSTCSLVAGRAVDVVSRKTATVSSCIVWSVMAAATAFANGFPAVFGLRVLQGSAQAFTTPAAYTMISDLFPASSRGTANSIYSSGVYLGGALASLSLLLNGAIGWRDSHLVVAAVGFAIALLSAILIQEPAREFEGGVAGNLQEAVKPAVEKAVAVVDAVVKGDSDEGIGKAEDAVEDDTRESFREALGIVFQSNTVKLLFAATAFRFCAGFGIGVWCAPFFRGRYPSSTSEFSVLNAFVVAGGGLFSSFLGGVISDKYSPADPRVRAWVPMLGCLLAIPCWTGVITGSDFYVSLAFLLAEYVVAECWFGPTVTILQDGLPPNVRGVGQGVFSTLSAFGTLAPPFMGALIQRGGYAQQDVLLWTVGVFYAISAACFFFVGESVLADYRQDKAKNL